jgi:hypothetical protein
VHRGVPFYSGATRQNLEAKKSATKQQLLAVVVVIPKGGKTIFCLFAITGIYLFFYSLKY